MLLEVSSFWLNSLESCISRQFGYRSGKRCATGRIATDTASRVHLAPANCVRGPEWCHIASELLLCHAGANDGFGCVVLSHTVAGFGAEEPEFHRKLDPAVSGLACGHDWRRLIVCGVQNGAI